MAGPKSFSTKVVTKLTRDGPLALCKSALHVPRSISSSVTREVAAKVLLYRTADNVIDREELVRASGDRAINYGEEEEVSFDTTVEELPEELNGVLDGFSRPRPNLVEISDAKLLWEGSPALSSSDDVVLETAENDRGILKHRIKYALSGRRFSTVLTDLQGEIDIEFPSETPLFLLVRHPTTNYYHWIVDYLPKLMAFDEFNSRNNERSKILIENDPPCWVVESLESMGYTEQDWTNWTNESARIERLLVPQHTSRTRGSPPLPSPYECRFVRDRVLDDLHRHPTSDYIFISRQRSRDRRIRNVDEIEGILTELGFDTVILEEMSFPEQASLFSHAEVVVGVHGAGLTNLIFGTDLDVVEIFPDSEIRDHYFYLSEVLGHRYNFLVSDQVGADVEIEPTELKTVLEHVITEQENN